MKFKLLVINSPNAVDRHNRVAQMLAGVEFEWDYIYASKSEVDALNYNTRSARRHAGRELLNGELGCYASHYKCWKSLVSDQSVDYLLVMEDDVFLDVNFDFSGLVAFVSQCNIEYIRLYSRVMPFKKLIGSLGYRKIYRFKDVAYGTQCYLISKPGAEKLIRQADAGVARPVDDEMDRFWANKLLNLAIFPYPALELSYPSTIRDKKPNTNAKGLDYFLFRAQLKLNGYFRKFYNLRLLVKDSSLKQAIMQFKEPTT